jgi:glyoxylase-like metal-dependent hydrolase (beta-lactamase superfamily II)
MFSDKFNKAFTRVTTLVFAMLLLASGSSQAKPSSTGFYRLMLGDFEITVLSDGTVKRPVDEIMSKPDVIRKILAADHETEPYEISVNAFLINTGTKLILVDTGAGELFAPACGRLVDNLHSAGYRPEQIDAILLTHIHADHSGGLSMGGKRLFTNAVVFVDEREPALWLDPKKEEQAPQNEKRIFQQSHATIDPYVKAGRFKTFDGATALFPGIKSVPAYGHTPGHTAYMVESKGQRLLLWGDIVHCAEVQFSDPTITIEYDLDPDAAIATRKKLMFDAAKQGYLVGGAHISFPGLGHVCIADKAYKWIPLPFSATSDSQP